MMSRKKNSSHFDPFAIKKEGVCGRLEKVSYSGEWAENSFNPGNGENEVVGSTFNLSKLGFSAFILLFFILILAGRVFWLQILEGERFSALAERNSIRLERIEAQRGVIYDRENRTLVRNVANFLLYLVPVDLPRSLAERDALLERAVRMAVADEEKYNEVISTVRVDLDKVEPGSLEAYQPIFMTDNIPYEKALKIYLAAEEMPGIVLSSSRRREYLSGEVLSMSHILGYTGKISEAELERSGENYLSIDYIGKTGIENFWESELRGRDGKKKIEVDALGSEEKIISKIDEEDGHNLVLTIDFDLQKKSEEVLLANLAKMKLTKGAVVILDPRNGELLSLVSLPSFDNNFFARGISVAEYGELMNNPDNPFLNRAIAGEYPSGSTIKPVVAQAALEERIISENTTFLSTGGLTVGQWFFPDWRSGGHGRVNVRQALANSVNTFFYYIGGGYDDFVGLGVEKMGNYFRLFGLGSQSGIDLPAESQGFVPTKDWKEETKNERWYIGDTYHLAIGQGDLLVTPLQIADFTAVFANKGTLYRPHIVKSILNSDDTLIRKEESQTIRENFLDPYNLEVVRQGMRQTITKGSGIRLNSLSVEVAGKTGTAQWNTQKDPHAWFTSFAPYENPEIVVTVLVEEGKEGSQIALTIAKEILEYYFGEKKDAISD